MSQLGKPTTSICGPSDLSTASIIYTRMLTQLPDDIPEEILSQVADNLAPDPDAIFTTDSHYHQGDDVTYSQVVCLDEFAPLCALSLVSRKLHRVTIPVLYRTISIVDDGTEETLEVLHNLLNTLIKQDLGKFTRTVNYSWVCMALLHKAEMYSEMAGEDVTEEDVEEASPNIDLFQHFLQFLSYRSTLEQPLSTLSFRELRQLDVLSPERLNSDSAAYPVANITRLHVDKLHSAIPDVLIPLSSFISVDHLSLDLGYQIRPNADDPPPYCFSAMTNIKSLVLRMVLDHTSETAWDDFFDLLKAYSGQLDDDITVVPALEGLCLDIYAPRGNGTDQDAMTRMIAKLSPEAMTGFKRFFEYFSNTASTFPHLRGIHLVHPFFNQDMHNSARGGEMASWISACLVSLKATSKLTVIEIGRKQEYSSRATVSRTPIGKGYLYDKVGYEWRDLGKYVDDPEDPENEVILKARERALNPCNWSVSMDIF